MTKEQWINEAIQHLKRYAPKVAYSEWYAEYAEALHETYVIDDPESEWTPRDAVLEDVSYWGD